MRDVERLREKHQLSLDDRQIAALAFCALLLLAGVFSLGVALGKRSSPPPAQPSLAQLDEAALPEQGKPPVSIPEEKPRPPVKVAAQADAPRVEAPRAIAPPPARAPLIVPPPPRPVQLVSAAPIALSPPPKELGQFTVQVGASQEKSEAQKLESRARAAGLKPYVVSADLGAKGVWYRVRVGAFADKESAGRFRKDVEREMRTSAVVMSTR